MEIFVGEGETGFPLLRYTAVAVPVPVVGTRVPYGGTSTGGKEGGGIQKAQPFIGI